MARTPPDLSGVYLKLERAETHIQTFSDEVAAFSEPDPKPFGFRTEDTIGTDKSIKYDLYAVIREEPPRELALLGLKWSDVDFDRAVIRVRRQLT
jgi:integrase